MIAISRIRTSLKRERCSENTPQGEEENDWGMEEGAEGGEVVIGSMDGISLSVEGMQIGRCWLASCTGPCVCAGYEGRCCSAGSKSLERKEEVEVTPGMATSRERFLRLRG